MTMSPWSIRARQNRDTSRAHPGSGRPLCAEAAETIRTKGMTSKNLVILNAFLPINERDQRLVPQEGLEPPTPSLRMTCSTS